MRLKGMSEALRGKEENVEKHKRTEYTDLSLLIGHENYLKLIEKFGGTQIYIPTLHFVNRDQRERAIKNDFYKGANICDLVNKYSLSESTIRRILRKR